MLKELIFICSFTLLSASIFAQENMIKNGQFIDGTEHWQVLLNDKDAPIKAHIEHGKSYKEYGLADNFIGTNFVELDEKSAIQQTVLTRKGNNYTVIFAFAHRPGAGTKQLIVTAGGKAIYTTTIKNADGQGHFVYKHVTFAATDKETKLGFYSVSILGGAEDKGILLTDIMCSPSSEVDLGNYSDKKF